MTLVEAERADLSIARLAAKELIHAFISGVTVRPDEARLDVMVAQIPALAAKSSVDVVAGARYEPLQTEMNPVERFLAGLKRAA